MQRQAPQSRIQQSKLKIKALNVSLTSAITQKIAQARYRFEKNAESLNIVSPLATLHRGYAIVKDSSGTIVRHTDQLKPGEIVRIAVAEGAFEANITNTKL